MFCGISKTTLLGESKAMPVPTAQLMCEIFVRIEAIVVGGRALGSTSKAKMVGTSYLCRCTLRGVSHTVWFSSDDSVSVRDYRTDNVIEAKPMSVIVKKL